MAIGICPAAAGGAFLDGRPFAEAIGRRQWYSFMGTLAIPELGERHLAAGSAQVLAAEGERTAAACGCLSDDVTAVVDVIDAAQWWLVHRDTDVTRRVREILHAVPRHALERCLDDRSDVVASRARTALLILDGHELAALPRPGANGRTPSHTCVADGTVRCVPVRKERK